MYDSQRDYTNALLNLSATEFIVMLYFSNK